MNLDVNLAELEQGIRLQPGASCGTEHIGMTVVNAPCGKCGQCVIHEVVTPRFVAMSRSRYVESTGNVSYCVNDAVLRGAKVSFGPDITHALDRDVPTGVPVGSTPWELKLRMGVLRRVFAVRDGSGMAKALFEAFWSRSAEVRIFSHPAFDDAVASHEGFAAFSAATKDAFHAALKGASWDLNRVLPLTKLPRPPVFNKGKKAPPTGDWVHGLAVMVNDVQYVFVYVDRYRYSSCEGQYEATLRFALYDVFGLDDDDLKEYGATIEQPRVPIDPLAPISLALVAAKNLLAEGITAWWQLQHQFDYAPLLTRATVVQTITMPTDEVESK